MTEEQFKARIRFREEARAEHVHWRLQLLDKLLSNVVLPPPKRSWWKRIFKTGLEARKDENEKERREIYLA